MNVMQVKGQYCVYVCFQCPWHKLNVMIVMQKIKFMLEFTFAINVECLHSSLKVKLLIYNCTRANHAKTSFIAYKKFLKISRVEDKCI